MTDEINASVCAEGADEAASPLLALLLLLLCVACMALLLRRHSAARARSDRVVKRAVLWAARSRRL